MNILKRLLLIGGIILTIVVGIIIILPLALIDSVIWILTGKDWVAFRMLDPWLVLLTKLNHGLS